MHTRIPENWAWSASAPGRYETEMEALAIMIGGHVGASMDANIYSEKRVLAKSNAGLVAKVFRIAKELAMDTATADEAGEILELKPES